MIGWVFIDNRGSTLIIITWLFAIIGIITAFIFYRSELEWAAVVNMERSMQARQLAEEVLAEKLVLLTEDDTEHDSIDDPWFCNGYQNFERSGFQISILIEDEGSKPNLNLLTGDDLRLAGLDQTQIDPLLDWIDRDDDLRGEGAESEYYNAKQPAYKPKNTFLASPREILALKNGTAIYEAITPHTTVFGRYNPNAMDGEAFGNLLLAAGFQSNWVERVVDEFRAYRRNARFNTIDDFLKLSSVTLQTCEQLEPLLRFDGSCNVNLVSKTALQVVLNNSGYDSQSAQEIIRYRNEQPFTSTEEIAGVIPTKDKQKQVGDYFTTVSTIIRYRIWLVKGTKKFYLDTVQERVLNSNQKKRWSVTPLSYVFLMNNDVPEMPQYTKIGDQNDE